MINKWNKCEISLFYGNLIALHRTRGCKTELTILLSFNVHFGELFVEAFISWTYRDTNYSCLILIAEQNNKCRNIAGTTNIFRVTRYKNYSLEVDTEITNFGRNTAEHRDAL